LQLIINFQFKDKPKPKGRIINNKLSPSNTPDFAAEFEMLKKLDANGFIQQKSTSWALTDNPGRYLKKSTITAKL
jgi:hypothetical protein